MCVLTMLIFILIGLSYEHAEGKRGRGQSTVDNKRSDKVVKPTQIFRVFSVWEGEAGVREESVVSCDPPLEETEAIHGEYERRFAC
jgi:hypothetical protein